MTSVNFRSLYWLVHRVAAWNVLSSFPVGPHRDQSMRDLSHMRRDNLTAWVGRVLDHYPTRRWFK